MTYILFKKAFDQRLMESINTKDKQGLSLLIESLKKEQPLNELYYLISSIMLPDLDDEHYVGQYIDNLKLVSKDLISKLSLYESFFKSFSTSKDLELTDFEKSIQTLLFEKNTPYNVKAKTDAYKMIYEHISNHITHKKHIEDSENKLQEYSKLVESLNPEYKQVLKSFLLSEQKDVEFNKVKSETIDYLIDKMETFDNPEVIKEAVIKINKIKYDPNSYVEHIVEFLNLTSND